MLNRALVFASHVILWSVVSNDQVNTEAEGYCHQ